MKPCACSETNNTAMAVAAWRSANWARHGVRQTFRNFNAASLAGSSIGSGNRLRRLSTNASERCLDTRSILVSEHVAHLETSSAVAWINRERVGHARHSAGVVNGRRWGTAIPTVNMPESDLGGTPRLHQRWLPYVQLQMRFVSKRASSNSNIKRREPCARDLHCSTRATI